MTHAFFRALAAVALFSAGAFAQTVHFETNAGNFDVVLNPTNNPLLQGNVDNFLQYVTSGRYNNTVINRAEDGFVVQMGVFKSPGLQPPATISPFVPIQTFAPVQGEPAAEIGNVSNTFGTVSFALSGFLGGGTNQDSGTSSFFVNLGSNAFLDPDFTVFAVIPDMATLNTIDALTRLDYTADPNSGADPGNLALNNVPLLANGNLVVISSATVVPEPTTCVLLGMMLPLCLQRRRRRR